MARLLFEIGTEELPSWYVTDGSAALESLARRFLEEARLPFDSVSSYATPRRLAIVVDGLAEQSQRTSEKRRGPPETAAFDASGNLTKAAVGFAAANGVDASTLTVEDTDRGRYIFAKRETGGEPAAEILPGLLQRLVEEIPAPRKMRWADVETPFVRPVSWLVALLDDAVIPFQAAGVESGRTTYGHRFLAPGALELTGASAYPDVLADAQVVADEHERRERTWRLVSELASSQGLNAVADEELLAEVTNLVEMPVPILGSFDASYLELPDEVLITVMIHHQRYFPVRRQDGRLSNAFISVSNNRVPDEGVVRTGYEKVLDGRLYDARFFWRSDRGKSLSQHAWDLSGIQFHKDLGSMAEKVSRVGESARRLAVRLRLPEAELDVLEAALPIFRADLGTDMVFEFPELEGVMARAYAVAEGLGADVGQALEDGVKPKGPEDSLPSSDVGALLSVADRTDKLVGFFAAGRRVTGSADPYGLRRDALGLVRILTARGWRLPPRELLAAAAEQLAGTRVEANEQVLTDVKGFLWDRMASLLGDEGLSVHQIRAAIGGGPAFIEAAWRAHLLRALDAEPGFTELLALYKRAANLALKASGDDDVDPVLFDSEHEAPLYESLTAAREGVSELLDIAKANLQPWDPGREAPGQLPPLGDSLTKVLAMKAPLDSFLDGVLVMVEDEAVRNNRLALLREVRDSLRPLGRLEELSGG